MERQELKIKVMRAERAAEKQSLLGLSQASLSQLPPVCALKCKPPCPFMEFYSETQSSQTPLGSKEKPLKNSQQLINSIHLLFICKKKNAWYPSRGRICRVGLSSEKGSPGCPLRSPRGGGGGNLNPSLAFRTYCWSGLESCQ